MAAGDNPGDDAAQERIDPRYDPAFQRGYRGEVRRSAPSKGRQREKPFDRAPQPSLKDEHPAVADTGTGRVDAGSSDADAEIQEGAAFGSELSAERDAEIAEAIAPPTHLNPYIVALWIIGVGLTVFGLGYQIWAQSHSRSIGYNAVNGIPLDVILINIAYTVSTPMIIVGLATMVGLLFLLAARSRPRPGR